MANIRSILELTRIEHSVMLVIAVIAAELISGGLPSTAILLLSLITPIFVSMGAFAINDYFDIETDRLNKKNRPLVRGDIKPGEALYVTAASMVIGIIAGFMINIYTAAIAVFFTAIAILYSYRLKEIPMVGNAYVAFAMAIPFLFGNYAVTTRANPAVLVIFSMIFVSGLAREINGTMRDYIGDIKVRKAVTLPSVVGLKKSGYMALTLYIVAIAVSAYLFAFMPPFMGNLVYGVLILIVDIMLLYSGIVFALGRRKLYSRVRNISLGGMALALVSILISAVIYI